MCLLDVSFWHKLINAYVIFPAKNAYAICMARGLFLAGPNAPYIMYVHDGMWIRAVVFLMLHIVRWKIDNIECLAYGCSVR